MIRVISYVFSLIAVFVITACGGMNAGGFNYGSVADFITKGQKLLTASESLTPEQEYYLGRGVAAGVLGEYPPYGSLNSALNRYVNQVGQTLVVHSDKPYTYNGYYFLVVNSDEINAFATPGGFVFVTKGLVKQMPDEDALAGVLAHEIAHVVLEHGVDAVRQANLADVVSTIALETAEQQAAGTSQLLLSNTKNFGLALDDILETLLEKGYSRSQEYDADEYAAKLLARAGYNPVGLSKMLEQIEIAEKSGSFTGGFLSTHPSAEDRLDEVTDLDLLKELKDAKPDPGQLARQKRFRTHVSSLG